MIETAESKRTDSVFPRAQAAAQDAAPPDAAAAPGAADVAGRIAEADLPLRLGLLESLLARVGPLALAVLAGGAFAKYAFGARWPRLAMSLDEIAQVSVAQIGELVRYVEQSDPAFLERIGTLLSTSGSATAALGASVAMLASHQVAARRRPGKLAPR